MKLGQSHRIKHSPLKNGLNKQSPHTHSLFNDGYLIFRANYFSFSLISFSFERLLSPDYNAIEPEAKRGFDDLK